MRLYYHNGELTGCLSDNQAADAALTDVLRDCTILADSEFVEGPVELFAAAPDLLEAIRPFAALAERNGVAKDIEYDYHTRFDITHADVRRAVAAIAKAEPPTGE